MTSNVHNIVGKSVTQFSKSEIYFMKIVFFRLTLSKIISNIYGYVIKGYPADIGEYCPLLVYL